MNPRNQFHPRNQLLFITAASNEIIIIIIIIITIIIYVFIAITYCSSFFIAIIYCSSSGHRFFCQLYGIYSANCVVYTILVLVSTQPLRATSCYPSQRSPRNQLLFITAVSTQPVAIHSNVEFIIVQLYHWPSSKCHWARGKLHATSGTQLVMYI